MRAAAGAVLMRRAPVAAAYAAPAAAAPSPQWRHGISLLAGLKYPDGFRHFDYVDPLAPKGGTVRRAAIGTFDSFNMVVAGVKGDLVEGIESIYDTLMAPSLDEVASEYGLIAEAA